VGSGALTLKKALLVAAIFEFLGAMSLGSRVAGTISKGIADPACYEGEGGLLMVGMLAALTAAGIWLIVASLFGLPVSTTHSIGSVVVKSEPFIMTSPLTVLGVVGAIIGMGVALKGPSCIKWGFDGMASIALSWVTSPVFAGAIAFGLYWLILRFIVHADQPVRLPRIILTLLHAFKTM
jgi:PiT family inorganic phosphate transporter